MKWKNRNQAADRLCLQEVQRKLACFEDDVLPYLPSKEVILARAKQRKMKKKVLGSAMLSVLGIAIGIYGYNPVLQQFDAQTLKGAQDVLYLSNGSKIHLNTDTKIQVQRRIRSDEVVLYSGEASFHVAHSKYKIAQQFERSFKVTAGAMEIIDIGTVFNVHKHNATDATVAVETGEVAVKIHGAQMQMLHLKQGQSVSNAQQKLSQVLNIDVQELRAWQSRTLILDQIPLYKVIENFQRYHDFDVQILSSDLRYLQISGRFKVDHYQEFMGILPIIAPLTVAKISDRKWVIKK